MQNTIKKTALTSAISLSLLLIGNPAMASDIPPGLSAFIDNFWSETDIRARHCKRLRTANPILMPRCMQADNVYEHLQAFQQIADENDGNRAAGLSGYTESVSYVADQLESMGYSVTYDTFEFNAFYEQADGRLSALSPVPAIYEWGTDFTYMSQTEAGDVTATVQAVDLDLGADNSSSSGCEIEDFVDFQVSNIALIQRGACAFQTKAENAAASGAVGAIIFNQGNSDDRQDIISGTLGSGYNGGIPVLFASYPFGETWAAETGLVMNMVADVLRELREVDNVIAETRWGNPDNVVMLGSHLDSVFEGPGINDNGSGSAGLLAMADLMKKARTRNKVRFAWWGAEEAGLVGSTDYVQRLSTEELEKIKVYLNFDMIGSPNFYYGIYDGDGSDFDLEGPAGSSATEAMFKYYFNLRGESFEGSEISFRSDYAEFFVEDVAFGGLFTGAEGIKSEEQAMIYGGTAGDAFDPCYHSACDTTDNLNFRALEVNADAIAFVTSMFARSTRTIDAEIEAAKEPEVAGSALRSLTNEGAQQQANDMDHWGQYWTK